MQAMISNLTAVLIESILLKLIYFSSGIWKYENLDAPLPESGLIPF